MAVGKVAIPASFSAIVDTGVALTYLTDPIYTNLTNTVSNWTTNHSRTNNDEDITISVFLDLSSLAQFNAQVKFPRKPDPGQIFDFCYYVRWSLLNNWSQMRFHERKNSWLLLRAVVPLNPNQLLLFTSKL